MNFYYFFLFNKLEVVIRVGLNLSLFRFGGFEYFNRVVIVLVIMRNRRKENFCGIFFGII